MQSDSFMTGGGPVVIVTALLLRITRIPPLSPYSQNAEMQMVGVGGAGFMWGCGAGISPTTLRPILGGGQVLGADAALIGCGHPPSLSSALGWPWL